jgi:hypothetical protein
MLKDVNEYTKEQYDEAFELSLGTFNKTREYVLCLGQSQSSKNIMFVLYVYNKISLRPGHSEMNFNFVKILSNDLVRAVKNARKVCGDQNIVLEADQNYKRVSIKYQVELFFENYPDLKIKLDTPGYFFESVKAQLEAKGTISHAQIEAINNAYDKHIEYLENKKNQTIKEEKYKHLQQYFFKEGDRVEITIKSIIAQAGFESDWGYTHIIKYLTTCDKIVIYSGTSPKDDVTEGSTIKATIKHKKYRDIEQTLIQRISIITECLEL